MRWSPAVVIVATRALRSSLLVPADHPVRAGADCVQASRGPLRGAPPTGPCAWALMFQIAQQGELASGYAHGRQAGVVEACDLASRPPDSRAIAPDWRDRADFSSSLSFRKHSPGPDRHAEHSHRVNIPSTNSPAKSFRIVRLWSYLVLRLAYESDRIDLK